jgi:UPF0755 protein
MNIQKEKVKLKKIGLALLVAFLAAIIFEVYIPKSFLASPDVVYAIKKGSGNNDISNDLEKEGIIKSALFFKWYVVFTGQRKDLQAGSYNLSPSMSIADIVGKLSSGDVIKYRVTILEGWNMKDILSYVVNHNLYTKEDFLAATKTDISANYPSLQDKPKTASLEGYLFPDTYQVSLGETPQDFVKNILANFNSKLTPELQAEIVRQHKSVFDVITMASIIEREVKTPQDKKIVAGILWKRIDNGMPLQVDATTYYASGGSISAKALAAAAKSPYNTYKYQGLPPGPISNPGIDSILAAIYPKDSPYWYYISADGTGKTIFSKTFADQQVAIVKYLNH